VTVLYTHLLGRDRGSSWVTDVMGHMGHDGSQKMTHCQLWYTRCIYMWAYN